ncbi:TPA: hypothetical protein ACS714_002982 [Providencia alcalifaciens]
MNSNNINTIQVKNFKVQGLDLIITTPDGKTEILKNGLSDIILGDVVLSTEQGVVLTQDEILSSISMNVGADAVYIKEQFVSDTVEVDAVEQKNRTMKKAMPSCDSKRHLPNYNKKIRLSLKLFAR